MQRYQQTNHALGSTAYLTVVIEDASDPVSIFTNLWQAIESFEQRFSRFLPNSELTKFNHVAGRKQPISPAFHHLLTTARDLAEKTAGLYNPFILPALQRAGYKGSWPKPEQASADINFETAAFADWSELKIGNTWSQIPEHTALDFGGIGKGALLDELAEQLANYGVVNYWLSLGGDVLCMGHDLPGTPWQIAIQHAQDDTKTVASVQTDGKPLAIATSGITKRRGQGANGAWHHIIDPLTGEPAKTDVLTATVCRQSATEADVFAKCLVIVGASAANELLKHVGQYNALLQIASSDSTPAITIHKLGTIWST